MPDQATSAPAAVDSAEPTPSQTLRLAAETRSPMLSQIKGSSTIIMTQRARDLRAEGRSIIGLSHGQPDFEPPEHIREAAIEAIRRGECKYPPVPGITELREAVTRKFRRDNGLEFSTDETIISTGAKQLLANALLGTLDKGDEVIALAPYFVSYPQLVTMAGAKLVAIQPQQENLKITPEQLAAAITPRTKWLILNSPCNPSGAVYSREELAALSQVLLAHPHVSVLSDDIYEHLVYEPAEFATMLQVCPELRDRMLIVHGLSKTYAMTGWRLGYAAGPAPLIRTMSLLQSQVTSGACIIAQWAAVAALDGPQDFVARVRDVFRARRDRTVALIRDVPGLTCAVPEGAFYVMPSCAALLGRSSPAHRSLETDSDFAEALLEEAGVSTVPGSAFGLSGHFRISYAAAEADLEEACARIRDFCKAISPPALRNDL